MSDEPKSNASDTIPSGPCDAPEAPGASECSSGTSVLVDALGAPLGAHAEDARPAGDAAGICRPPASVPMGSLPAEQRSRLQTIVRGGTTTSAFDNELAMRKADAEARREQDDQDKKIASVPVEKGGGLMFERRLADPMTGPRVLLTYVGDGKEEIHQQLAELVEDDITGDHILIFVCPECFRRGIPSGFCQCHARCKHRAWHIDKTTAGQVKGVRNSDAPGGMEFYTSAGMIMDTDVLRCDAVNCGNAYKIHKNVMYRVR